MLGFAGRLYAHPILTPLFELCRIGMLVNFFLAVFNLIPIPPLDGSWILYGFLPPPLSYAYDRFRPYGFLLLLLLVYSRVLSMILNPVANFLYSLLQL
jgi:Zn-dependent protease